VTIYYKKEIMAININSVYKTVLSILNKEQRGFLNPDEYNNIAKQVQLEMLEKLFYDYNKFLNIEKAGRINETLADIPRKIQEQLDEFYASTEIISQVDSNTGADLGIYNLPSNLYKIINVMKTNQNVEIEKIDKNKLPYLKSSPLTAPSAAFPVYNQRESDIVVDPAENLGSTVTMQYIKTPDDPRWGYTIDPNYGVNIYDSLVFSQGGLINNRTLASSASSYTTTTTDATNGTYNTFTTSGSGTGASLTLTISGQAPTTLVVGNAGSGYSVGDVITFPNTGTGSIGGSTAVKYTIKAGDTFDTSTRGSTNFTLHPSQEPELIVSILAYAGFAVKNLEVFNSAVQLGQGAQITKQQQ